MESSDSEDDYYGNAAKKFESLKAEYKSIKCDDNKKDINNDSINIKDLLSSEIVLDDFNTSVKSVDSDDFNIDALIGKNITSKRVRKRKTVEDRFESICERTTRSRRKTTIAATAIGSNTDANEILALESGSEGNKCNRTGRGKPANNSPRISRRGRGNSKARGATRGRGRGRGRGRNLRQTARSQETYYPTFNIGDVEEYPDMCGNQQLFSTTQKPIKSDDVEIIDDDDPLENENEEISVKVYWQNTQVFRFKIRRFQKLTQIFKYFSEKENVTNSNLLFMYDDRIVQVDDTPDTINYNIAKFIDGGIVNQDVTSLAKASGSDCNSRREVNDGLFIKFQCQSLKKPFEVTVRPENRLSTAMMLCAEHLEVPIEQLKFYFDGDIITGKMTPQELGLENGDCVDVKICS